MRAFKEYFLAPAIGSSLAVIILCAIDNAWPMLIVWFGAIVVIFGVCVGFGNNEC